ncbi:zona pellucida sperm-binding protein 1-like [Engystomops pustulosus]|uniref:zona pellucida sperm-binding protein 1-like n=1 Tax=Engystomops pustulosus TaxID=76066 RepID=UPI003AFA3885
MVALQFLDGLWLLVFTIWPLLLGSCIDFPEADYKCGVEGVQLLVPPKYLGGEITFQIRDEFQMGYGLHGCLTKCLLSTRGPKGESVFYAPYTICLSVRKEHRWLLRVRLVGHNQTEDLDLICPKPKKVIQPRDMFTPITRSTKPPKQSPEDYWNTTQYGPTKIPTMSPLGTPKIRPDHRITTSETKGVNVATQPVDYRPKVAGTTKDAFSLSGQQTRESPRSTDSSPTPEPDMLTPSQCSVSTGRVTCLNSTVSRGTCLDYRCCHDPRDSTNPCYYGHTVTVHCFQDGLFRLILSRYVTNPPLRLSSIVLGPGTCPPPTILGDFLEFRGYLLSCSARRFVEGRLVYELSLTAKPDILVTALGSITRDSSLMVLSQCFYNNTLSKVSLVVLDPQPPTVTSTGVLRVELHISKGSSFSSFYASEDFPLQVPLRELVFLEARLLQPSDPRLHLRLHQCWGAPSMDPASTVRWPVIHDGCPFSHDDAVTKILPGPVPSSYQRFAVSAFTFVGFQNNTEVYFFCSVSVCLPSLSEGCTSDCAGLIRSRRGQPDDSRYLVGTAGALVFHQEKRLGLSGLQHLTSTLPGILLAAMILIVVLLIAGVVKMKSGFIVSKECSKP